MNHLSNADRRERWLERLQASGYRLTTPLKIIVDILTDSPRALDALQLFDLGRQKYPRMGLVTVYRALDKLEELGLVQRVHREEGCHAYLRAAEGHEHLLLCTRCGRGVFFAGDDLTLLFEKVARQSGYRIEEHWLQLYGLCENCQ